MITAYEQQIYSQQHYLQWFKPSVDKRARWHVIRGYRARLWGDSESLIAGVYVDTPCADARRIDGCEIVTGQQPPADGHTVCPKCIHWMGLRHGGKARGWSIQP